MTQERELPTPITRFGPRYVECEHGRYSVKVCEICEEVIPLRAQLSAANSALAACDTMKLIDGERFRYALNNPGLAMLWFAEATNSDSYGGQEPTQDAIRLYIRRAIDAALAALLAQSEGKR